MGQNLTHGVYLPDEGERNCYAGLAANWQILDTSVGTIAEHTTQIAGKAPAVHTHTKADITDFPAYGNAAGTICEGNDSRLSDARTPVAHTHGKADITDLLNSNFIPSANNSYDLGSSSYQWNNLYAKNYFYNGVAWGLDKANTWTNINTYQREICINGDRNAYIAPMWAGAGSGIAFLVVDASKQFVFGQRTTDANDRSCFDATKGFFIIRAGETGGNNFVTAIPYGTDTKLGDSTNKWKSLNGVNPGALSLPNYNNADPINFSQWSTAGAMITYTPTDSGWLQITVSGGSGSYITILDSGTNPRAGQRITGDGIDRLFLTYPVVANRTYWIYIVSSSIETARIIPCLGNV